MRTGAPEVPDATLYHEAQGTGPVLLCITGGPTDAGIFIDLARRLSDRFTVVTYDQRGHTRSPLHGSPDDISVEQHASDAAALLEAVTSWSVSRRQGACLSPGHRRDLPSGRARRLESGSAGLRRPTPRRAHRAPRRCVQDSLIGQAHPGPVARRMSRSKGGIRRDA